jgi:drug efflux transport system permease protein
MKLQRISAIARKEFLHIRRDPRSLGLGIAIPMLLLFLFGYALTLDVDRVPLAVWDQSATPASREFVSRFTGSRYFSLKLVADSYPDMERAIDTRNVLIALIIPPDFARRVQAGGSAPVQVILDGSDSTTATLTGAYAETVAQGFNRDILLRETRRMGLSAPAAALEIRPRVWYNADLLSRNAIVPGLIAIIMMVIAALLTSLTVAREWETGTMEQVIATPLTPAELVVGKLIPYIAIGMFDLALAVLSGRFIFDVPLRGSLLLLFTVSIIFLVGALSFGMLLGIITRSQFMASQLALVTTMLPAFLMSGFVFPIENMPYPIRIVTHLVTARYLVTMLRGIYLKEAGLEILAWNILLLVIFGVLVVTLCIRKFRKKIE